MIIGGYDSAVHDEVQVNSRRLSSSVAWTKVTSGRSYLLDIQSLAIDGEIVSGHMKHALVDSGTTYSYIPPQSYSALFDKLSSVCQRVNGCHPGLNLSKTCHVTGARSYDEAMVELDRLFPSLDITFSDGTFFKWRPRSYFYSKSGPG